MGETATHGDRSGNAGPPPLEPFGLVLHHDGSWTHEGQPVTNRKLRAAFDRGVRFLPDVGKFVVQLAHFRGQIELEEAGFFVRGFDPDTGRLSLSDRTEEELDVSSLRFSAIDGALLCTVKRNVVRRGLAARFHHAAHADFMNAVCDSGTAVEIAGLFQRLPDSLEQAE